jgi:hypothetical protein
LASNAARTTREITRSHSLGFALRLENTDTTPFKEAQCACRLTSDYR